MFFRPLARGIGGTIGHFSSMRGMKCLIVLSIMTVITRGEYTQIKQIYLAVEETPHLVNAIEENVTALPTKPGPIAEDTQATSTHTLRPSDPALAEWKDPLAVTSAADRYDTRDPNSPVGSPTTPDSSTESRTGIRVESVDTGPAEASTFTADDYNSTTGGPTESHTEESLGATQSHVPLSATRATTLSKVRTCGTFSCTGTACYKGMNATEICREGMSYCELWRSVTRVAWNQYASVWTAGCVRRCGPGGYCSPLSGYRCRQECCEARAVSCLRLDGSVGTATATRPYAPAMPALMIVASRLMGLLLS